MDVNRDLQQNIRKENSLVLTTLLSENSGNHVKQRITKVEVERRITNERGTYELLLETARRKLQWLGHTSRRTGTLAYDIIQGSVKGSSGRGRPKRTWFDDIKEWSGRSVT